MSITILRFGAYLIMANYIERKAPGGVFYFRRRIPRDMWRHYPKRNKRNEIYHSLRTKDEVQAARKAHRLVTQQDALWKGLRSGQVAHIPETIQAALALLEAHDVRPEGHAAYDAANVEFGYSAVEPESFFRELHYQAGIAGTPEPRRDRWNALPPVHKLAADPFHGAQPPVFLSDALREYQALKGEDNSTKSQRDRARVVDEFIALFGDLPLEQYTRENANALVGFYLERGNKTTTAQRRIRSIAPIFKTISREHEGLEDKRIFEGINIPNVGKDTEPRLPYTSSEIELIQRSCLSWDDDMRWIIALVSDSGMRLAEAVGLRVQDIDLSSEVPSVAIIPHEARRVKAKASERRIPLVGAALWGVSRALDNAEKGFLFPRYIGLEDDNPEHRATSASNSLVKWLRRHDIKDPDLKVGHSFRHSMQDRLRDAHTPPEIRNAICGWRQFGKGADYGDGYSLETMAAYLSAVVNRTLFPSETRLSVQRPEA